VSIRRAVGVAASLLAAAAAHAEVRIETFKVPSGAHPHDVAPAPDGKVWYTAQHQGALGILDPATGKTEHVALGEKSSPHGVTPDRTARRGSPTAVRTPSSASIRRLGP
jgi:virginiamycin B lyase